MPRVPGGKPSPRERNRINPQRRFDFEAGEKTAPLPEYWLQQDLYAQQVQAYMQMGPTYAGIERSTESAFRAQGPTVAGEPITIERMRQGAARSMRGTITGRHVPPPDIQRLGPYDVHYAPRGGRGVDLVAAMGAYCTEEMRALGLAIMERIVNPRYVVLPSAEACTITLPAPSPDVVQDVVARLEQREREIRQSQEEQMLREERERQQQRQAEQMQGRMTRDGFGNSIYFLDPEKWT